MVRATRILTASAGLAQPPQSTQKLLEKAVRRVNGKTLPLKHIEHRLKKHSDIINQSLCDDTIAYLAPSLEAYKGATIFDINPGTCLWSKSLHDFLKPKHHVLLEPNQQYFEPFIKPLLEQDGSTYVHMPIHGVREKGYFHNWQTILAGSDDLPPRPSLKSDDARLGKLDTSVLVTGNLRRFTMAPSTLRFRFASMVVMQTAWAAHSNQLFHNTGRVRMLWWLPEAEVRQLVPQDHMSRTALSTGLEMTSDVHFVVGTRPLDVLNRERGERNQRGPQADQAAAAKVKARMSQQGLAPPSGRELLLPSPSTSEPYPDPLETSCTTCDDLERLLSEYETRRQEADEILKKAEVIRPTVKECYELAKPQLVYTQVLEEIWTRPRQFYIQKQMLMLQVMLAIDLVLQVARMEAEWFQLHERLPDEEERLAAIKTRIAEAGRSWAVQRKSLSSIDRTNIIRHANHLRLEHAKPQPVLYDERPYEPIKAERQDFWPEEDLALLDVIPREVNLGAEGICSASEGASFARELIKHLYTRRSDTVATSLERLAPNACEDLLPQLPELGDPQKGGQLDPSKVEVRQIHRDTFLRLLHAFLEWPFRPEAGDLAMMVDDVELADSMEAADRQAALSDSA